MITVDQAMEIINESRHSHVAWKQFYQRCPEAEAKHREVAGSMKEQEEQIAKYDQVLELLRNLQLQRRT